MIEVMMGLDRDIRTNRLFMRVQAALDQGHNNMYLLVPEQATFQYQRELVRRFGPSVALQIEVIDFPLLAERVFESCGGRKRFIDPSAKMLLLSIAVNRVAKNLSAYRDTARRPEFISRIASAMEMFQKAGMNIENLRTAGMLVKKQDERLAQKLEDMAVIVESYQTLALEAGAGGETALELLPSIMVERGFLPHTRWFIDGFVDFSQPQKKVMEMIFAGAEDAAITLPCAGTKDIRASSQRAVRTAQWIFLNCSEREIPCAATRTEDCENTSVLSRFQAEICSSGPAPELCVTGAEKAVRLFADATPHAECTHIAGSILRAVRNGYRYREVSLVLCDYERYAPVLDAVFRRYDIPLYLGSRKEEVTRKPVMLALYAALDSASHGMRKEDVLSYLKAGFSSLDTEEVALLENYVLTWNIRGRGWEPDPDVGWTMHPDGFGLELDEAAANRLLAINEIRQRGIGPLLRLKDAMREAETVAEHIEALSSFLQEIQFTTRLQEYVDAISERGEAQTAQEYAQIFNVIDAAMAQMYELTGELKQNGSEFSKLFRQLCGTYRIKTIPPLQDQVCAYSIADARFFCSKIRFIVGADDQSLPKYEIGDGLFSSSDATALKEADIHIPGDPADDMEQIMSDIYLALSGAKRMLVFSYSTEGGRSPSPLYFRALNMLPTLTPETGVREDRIFQADLMHPVRAGELLGRISTKSRYREIALAIAVQPDERVQSAAVSVMDKTAWDLERLSRQAVKGLYGEVIPLSASRVDSYSSCRYHFFLRYGLGLKVPNRNKLTGPVVGNFYHEIIEQVCREVEDACGGFQKITDTEVTALARKHIRTYTKEKMGGLSGESERNSYLYRYMCREVMRVVRTLAREFRNSDFRPAFFELKIGGEHADVPAIEIRSEGLKGRFTGRVDRVDTFRIGDRTIMRINDYKTGSARLFSLTDILTGQGAQLLVYNQAVMKDGLPGISKIEPAGILYTPAKHPIVATRGKETPEKVAMEREKLLKREGILLGDKEILNAMEHFDAEENLLPFRVTAQGEVTGSICTAEQMADLNAYAELVLENTLRDLGEGVVAANPISHGQRRTACTYCPHKDACHKEVCGTKYRYIEDRSREEALAEIGRQVMKAGKRAASL